MDDFFSFFLDWKDKLGVWWEAFNNSTFFFVVKVILILYITILIVDIILLIYLDGLRKRLRQQFRGMNVPILSKKKKQKEWDLNKNKLVGGNEKQFKLVILEADKLVDSYLLEAGYQGENLTEKLVKIPQHFSSNIDAVKESHNLRNEIIRNESLVLTKEEVGKNLEKMEKLLGTLNIL